MPETILTTVIDWVLSKRNKTSIDFKIWVQAHYTLIVLTRT